MARTAATTAGSHDREGHMPRRSVDHPIRGERGREGHLAASDAAALAAELRTAVRGEVRFDDGSRALYSMDASNYRQAPIGVVLPRNAEDIVQTLAVCRRYGAPVLPRGGGTSLAGQCCNVAVVLDTSKYLNRVLALDPGRRSARVQPGVVLDDLRDQAERHHLTFGPDPSTHNRCTLGGMIGNDSCGVHSVMAGKTVDNVEELEVLTYDGLRLRVGQTSETELEAIIHAGGRRGEIYAQLLALRDRYGPLIREQFPRIPRRVSGYNLDALLPENGFHVARALVGAEGTCVTVLEATLRLVASPPARVLALLGYPDIYRAADEVMEVMGHQPIGLEGFDDRLIADMRKKGLHPEGRALLPEGGGWLLVEFGGASRDEAADKARALMAALGRQGSPPQMALLDDAQRQKLAWEVRESGLGGTARTPGGPETWPGWEDSAVPPEQFGGYLRDLRALLDQYGYGGAFYGHFGQGCLHTRIDFDLQTEDGIARFRSLMNDAADLVVHYGGSLSGEHGDGQARAELLSKMYGEELVEAFRAFKAIWDPDWKMNPGKVVDAYRMDENLRLGVGYAPAQPVTHFKFPEDHGSLAHATLRCVGVGKCRRMGGGTMCPSYMVTREEADSTRGRAHLLFEMLQGDVTTGGWHDEHVKDALDLCLACKGCKGECPINVDVATYKAEFLSHYYAGRLRPRAAYSMGLIYWWAGMAARLPRLANALTHAPLLVGLAKRLGGIAPQRAIPAFAPQTFKAWFHRRAPRNPDCPQVMLWADTFNNHFHPETAAAAVEVLEAAGYQVVVPKAGQPRQTLCCGRPLYDYGMLDLAESLLRRILDTLRPQIRAGIPLVGLEPSCVSVLRDELLNLFPNDEDAHRLARQTFLLSEFLERCAPDFQLPQLRRKAVVHGHCHHKAVLGMRDEERILARLGLEYEILDSGCCGMAGAFGFERDHYDVSMKVGERVLLPGVRAATTDTLVIADGFSCREQIAQATDRRALHLAQVIQMALREGESSPAASYPEAGYAGAKERQTIGPLPAALVAAAGMAVGIAGAALWWWIARRKASPRR
jgi:FAD/FMN-containing dehydrogenase/Fe-S oxidoreductase